MMVTFRCHNGHEFDGHWHKVKERRQQYPDLSYLSNIGIVEVCPKCGDFSNGKNIDSDEDFNDREEVQENEDD